MTFSKSFPRSVLGFALLSCGLAFGAESSNLVEPSSASRKIASAESAPPLTKMIACHEALVGRSTGTSEQMTVSSPIPFVFQAADELMFVTDTSMAVLSNKAGKLNGQVFIVALRSQGQESRHEIEVRKKGELGSVCCGDGSRPRTPPLAEISVVDELSPRTRAAFIQELYVRLQSVAGEYQNRDGLMGTATALESCRGLPFKDNIVEQLITKYSKSKSNHGREKSAPLKANARKGLN